MMKIICTIGVSFFLPLSGFDWAGEEARKISDMTEVILPVLGFASVVLNSELGKNRVRDPFKINGVEVGGRFVSQNDAKKVGETLLRLGSSFLHVSFYKSWVKERRPVIGRENKFFNLPKILPGDRALNGSIVHSFPSSHASKMFFGAGTIHSQLGFKVAAPFYLMGTACAVLRLTRDNHFVHDLIAGAMIGTKMALTTHFENLVPTPLYDGGVVDITFRF